jgi:hypothetical protein
MDLRKNAMDQAGIPISPDLFYFLFRFRKVRDDKDTGRFREDFGSLQGQT